MACTLLLLVSSVKHDMFLNIYFYLFLPVLGLCCCAQAFSSCVRQVGATLHCGVWSSHFGDLSPCRAQALGPWALVVVAHGLRSCVAQSLVALQHVESSQTRN